MANYPILTTTPIKEIIFTISYTETVSPDVLKSFRDQKQIIEKYNLIREGFETQVVATAGVKPEARIKNDGYILRCETEDKVVQAREGSLSFHKMKVYEDFEKLLSELLFLWNLLIECNVSKLSVNNISLRYLNFIELNENESIGDLINVKPAHPFSEHVDNYFMQLKFSENAYQINVITTAPVVQDSKIGLVLDTIVNKPQNSSNDYEALTDDFRVMRAIKNKVFFESVASQALNKYL